MRKEAAEENEKLLLDMQTKVNARLQEMDNTIKCVHKGQTLNDQNIKTMMSKMDVFSMQIQKLEAKLSGTPIWEETEMVIVVSNTVMETSASGTAVTQSGNTDDECKTE